MTTLAESDYFDDEDYQEYSSRYEEGFGHVAALDDDDSGFDEIDALLAGFDVDDSHDPFGEPAKAPKSATRKAATPKATGKSTTAKSKGAPKASAVVTRRIEPPAVVVIPEVPETPDSAAPSAPETETVILRVDTALLKKAEAPAVAPAAVQTQEPEPVVDHTREGDPFFTSNIAAVNAHVEVLRKLRPQDQVPYVDPMHSAEDARILTLFSNNFAPNPKGTVWAGDDEAATRLLGMQFQLGLRPEWLLPWNTSPWFAGDGQAAKLTPTQVTMGLKPLMTLLTILPRVSSIVAHGGEANRLAQALLKTEHPLIYRRGLKVYKVKNLHGRGMTGNTAARTEAMIEIGRAYADAMSRAGLSTGRG